MFSIYCIFCITTALIANYRIFSNVLTQISADDLLNENKFLARTTFFILSLIAAPILFFVVLFPSIEKTFTSAMANSIVEKN